MSDENVLTWVQQVYEAESQREEPEESAKFDLELRPDDRPPGFYEDGIVVTADGIPDRRFLLVRHPCGQGVALAEPGNVVLQGAYVSSLRQDTGGEAVDVSYEPFKLAKEKG